MTWLPTGNALVVRLALPADKATVPSKELVVVSRKSTLPVGVPDPLARTVAVKVTVWFSSEVAALEVSDVKLSDVAVCAVPLISKTSPTAEIALAVVL